MNLVMSLEFRTFAKNIGRIMIDYKDIERNVNNEVNNEVNIHLELDNGLVIDVSGYNRLSQTCWITFTMKDLGKYLGKEYINDEYYFELAVWDVRHEIEEIINKIK